MGVLKKKIRGPVKKLRTCMLLGHRHVKPDRWIIKQSGKETRPDPREATAARYEG